MQHLLNNSTEKIQLFPLVSPGFYINMWTFIGDTATADWKVIAAKGIKLKKGENKIRIKADKGGFRFKSILFIR